jgi:hypothetical protein
MKAKAIFFTGVNEVAIGNTDIPEPEPLEVLIKAHYTCISPGAGWLTLSDVLRDTGVV